MKKIVLALLILSVCANLCAQDAIVLKDGTRIEGRILKTDGIRFDKLFYKVAVDGDSLNMFQPVSAIRYITIGAENKDYTIERYDIDPVSHDYRMVVLAEGSLRVAPVLRHAFYLEAGVGRFYGSGGIRTNPMINVKYLYFPKEGPGFGVMGDYSVELKTGNNIFYLGPVVSLRQFFNNSGTFLFTDISAGYSGIILQNAMAGATVSNARVAFRLGGETMASKDSPIAITYSAGCHYMISFGRYNNFYKGLILTFSAGVRFGK